LRYPAAIIDDLDAVQPAVLESNLDGRRSSVKAVLDELLDCALEF
jgi:hypothetical protein